MKKKKKRKIQDKEDPISSLGKLQYLRVWELLCWMTPSKAFKK